MTSRCKSSCRAKWIISFAVAAAVRAAVADVTVYPDGPLNPRVPVIAPVAGEKPAWSLPFDTDFSYAVAPAVLFPHGGTLSLKIRDDLRRAEKKVLVLTDGTLFLTLRIAPASQNRAFECILSDGGSDVQRIPLTRPADGWTTLEIAWDGTTVIATQDGKSAKAAWPHAFAPKTLAIRSGQISDLSLVGDGRLTLDWSDGYAAHLTPAANAHGQTVRLLGFDTFVVSADPQKRDCPMVEVLNDDKAPKSVTVEFDLTSEVNHDKQSWRQTIAVDGGSSKCVPLKFPQPLKTDVYHLTARSNSAAPAWTEARHFLFAQRRPEPAGPGKFGLHDSAVKQFGFWPDALPIDLAHIFVTWAVVQGPPWTRDFDGRYGIDPDLPPEQWNWNPRLDWAIAEGHRPYVSLQSVPFLDWQRGKTYPEAKMRKYDWGLRGGTPNDARYRHFLQAIVERYRGKVWAYEVENEPNTDHGFLPDDYAVIAKDVHDVVKATDPQARVFGICGTSTFVTWMKKVFDAGGAAYLDGVSWHTYITPATPEQANLGKLLSDADYWIRQFKPGLAVLNSETGTYVAPREVVDQPIDDERLKSLIAAGQSPLNVAKGWPSRAMSERAGAASMIGNAITNFLAGAEFFTFFGWNPQWPKEPKWWGQPFDDSNFGMISVAKDSTRTPSQFTLAAAVLTTQMEPAVIAGAKPVDSGAVHGGWFPKQGGGNMAVLWSTVGRQTTLVRSPSPEIEVVQMLGQGRKSAGFPDGEGGYLHLIDIGPDPVYLHQPQPGLAVQPTIVTAAPVPPAATSERPIALTVRNPFNQPWQGTLAAVPDPRWTVSPATQSLSLAAGESKTFTAQLKMLDDLEPGRYPVGFTLTTPANGIITATAEVAVTPTVRVPMLANRLEPSDMPKWNLPTKPLQLDRVEQVVVGRPPALASLQEKSYWGGASELSARVQVAGDAEGLSIGVEVTDANASLPQNWPGVGGSCVELFLDSRPPSKGLGAPPYTDRVVHLVLRPALAAGQKVEAWQPSGAALAGVAYAGGRTSPTAYWVAAKIPWKDLNLDADQPFGLDVGINGAKPGGGRKTQMMLFGTATNNLDASHFGTAFKTDGLPAER